MAMEHSTKDKKATKPVVGSWQSLPGSLLVYRGPQEGNSQAWLLTFTDLSALMLTFFVLLFSMSSIKSEQWQNLIDALSRDMVGLQEVTVALPDSEKSLDEVVREPGLDLDYLAAVLKEQMGANEVLTQAEVKREAQRLVVSVPGDLLFASGSMDLGSEGETAVFALAGVLRNLRNVIEVAGHADPQPPSGDYLTNWELSLARASAISGMLSKVGYQGGIVVRGYGHARYQEIDTSLESAERMAKARRVDIIIHDYSVEAR